MFGRKRIKITKEQMLGARPKRRPGVEVEETDEGELVLTISYNPSLGLKILARLFFVPTTRILTLDRIGSEIWGMCDGERRIEDIVSEIARRYKLNRREAEVAIITYIKKLGDKGALDLVMDPASIEGGI
jgi:hypothetical protein